MKFDCGCEFNPENLDLNNLNENCDKVWELLAQGLTYGVFQLETPLGRAWTKKLKPENIEHLAALGSILRPGSLKAKDENNISTTEHYIRRKNNLEAVESFDPLVDPILNQSYNLMIYQEQSMAIARAVAGYSLEEADVLRKAIGKKIPEVMAKCKISFLEGIKRENKISVEKGEQLWSNIEKSQRYAFNKSHAVSYGDIGFKTAWLKAHFPLEFFNSWLIMSKEKQDTQAEIKNLINEAKLMDIVVKPPQLYDKKVIFYNDGKFSIHFGLSNVKNIGEAACIKLMSQIEVIEQIYQTSIKNINWYNILINLLYDINKKTSESLIQCGALSYVGLARKKMLHDYNTISELTPREIMILRKENCDNLIDGLKCLSTKVNIRRKSIIESLVHFSEQNIDLRDDPEWILNQEEDLLGISLTCSPGDLHTDVYCNASCADFLAGRTGKLILAVNIDSWKEYKTKTDQIMAFLSVSDETGMISDCVMFADQWAKYKDILMYSKTTTIEGVRSRNNAFIINKVI